MRKGTSPCWSSHPWPRPWPPRSDRTGTGTTTSEPERTITGVVLVVTPQVNEEGYITMLVEPSVAKTVASKIRSDRDGHDDVGARTDDHGCGSRGDASSQ